MSYQVMYEIRTLPIGQPAYLDDFVVIEVLNIRPDAGTFRALGRVWVFPDERLTGPYSSAIINDESTATAGEEEE